MKLSRSALVAALSGLAAVFLPANQRVAEAATPSAGPPTNVIVLLIDDAGPEQFECYDPAHGVTGLDPGPNRYTTAYSYAPTPNITQIATEGVRFSHAFSAQICSPARGQFQTGRYPFRNTIGTTVTTDGRTKSSPWARQQLDLPDSEITMPEMLTALAPSYRSGYFGKWHLSREPRQPDGVPPNVFNVPGDHHPIEAGWPFYRGIIRNPDTSPFPVLPGSRFGDYTNYFYVTGIDMPEPSLPPSVVSRIIEDEYITTRQRKDVEEWILAGDEPFFAVWAATACHGPYEWPPSALHSFGSTEPDECNLWLRFRAILESLDTEIGNLRAALDVGASPTIWENTLVIIMGDNGTDPWVLKNAAEQGVDLDPYLDGSCTAIGSDPCPVRTCEYTAELRFKGTPYVGGTNVPMIVTGPGVTGLGSLSKALVDSVDVFDTLRDVTGIDDSSPEYASLFSGVTVDGDSIMPILDGTTTTGHSELLSLFYRPNGPWADRDQFRAAYTQEISGAYYRLVRSDTGSGPTEELYQLTDSSGTDVDPLEKTDIIGSASASIVTTMQTGLDSLLP